MNADTLSALRELLGRPDVIEAAAAGMYGAVGHQVGWHETDEEFREMHRSDVRAAFAAVLEMVGTIPAPIPAWEGS